MRMRGERLRVFSGTSHPRLAQDICSFMGVPLGAASLPRFPDGEINLKVECDVRGADVFVVQPTCPPVHDNLFELLAFAESVGAEARALGAALAEPCVLAPTVALVGASFLTSIDNT